MVTDTPETATKVRVLQLYRTFFPDTQGGAEEVVRQIARNVPPFGVEMRILVPSTNVTETERIQVSGVDLYRVPELCEVASCNIYKGGFATLRELVKWADVIHYHYPWPFQDVLHFALIKAYKKKTVVTYHADVIRQKTLLRLYSPLQKRFLSSVDTIVATSPAYKDSSSILRQYAEKVRVIPLGLDEDTLPARADTELLESWRSRVGEGFFFFVGVLRYYKGLDVLLKAAALSGLKVVIAGSGFEMDNLKSQVKDLQLKNVTLLGQVSDADKSALISLSRAMVLPSYVRSEAFGVSLLEGMYYSRPLITAKINTGVSYVNQDGVTGIAVAAQSARSLAHAMLRLNNDVDLAESMGRAARQRYETLFTGRQLGESYAKLYKELVAMDNDEVDS
jgi:glycosyltransferase involved in cell wall biosynthesis